MAWAWLRGVVLGFRVAASSLLSLKVAPTSHPPLCEIKLLNKSTVLCVCVHRWLVIQCGTASVAVMFRIGH